MTTAQESTNGHLPQKGYPQDALFAGNKVLPPPFPVENPSELNGADLPTNQDNNNHFAANAYHFPPKHYAPKATPYQYDDFASGQTDTAPLPGRCQFMFSDGRQCTMARSDIHPSLCRYHSEREEQLFGDPVSGGRVVGAACDLPELYSACRDLTTAAGVNRALAQVFRLLAQRRISRQEAATFAKLGHLLLRTISLARSESDAAFGDPGRANRTNAVILSEIGLADESKDLSASPPVNSSRESLAANVYPQDELRSVNKDHQELSRVNKGTPSLPPGSRSGAPMRPSTEVVIPKTSSPISAPTLVDRAEIGRSGEDEESRAGSPTHAASACVGAQSRRRNGVQHRSTSKHFPPHEPTAATTSLRMSTSAAPICNSPEISTYKNAEDQSPHNQHLQNNANKVGAERG